MNMDLARSIRMAVDTGKVVIGSQLSIKQVLTGSPKLVVVSSNCPTSVKMDFDNYCKKASVPILVYSGTSLELGTLCGKPFPISSMAIIEQGNSDILSNSQSE